MCNLNVSFDRQTAGGGGDRDIIQRDKGVELGI
jgi:hypothetical protein